MTGKDWNPDLYLKFNRERIQPSIDLISRIDYERPGSIIDIGCGPGNSTQVLAERWPDAEVTGVDNSPSMIEKAASEYPDRNWKLLDAGKDKIDEKFDIVFSNATIQWIPRHDKLLRKFHGLLNEGGVVAIQIPLFWDMPLRKSIRETARERRWESLTKDATALFTIHNSSRYYDILSEVFKSIDIWETHYIHIMDSHNSILEMIRSTGLKPYLNCLDKDKDKRDFEDLVSKGIKSDYPQQKDGKVLFPFKRLFFIAGK